MSRANALMQRIRDAIAVVDNQKGAQTKNALSAMENALADLTQHITTLGDIANEEVIPYKDELIGIMGMMDSLTHKIEASKTESREAIIHVVRKIKAQNSYSTPKK
ncbi:MAG: hypothetical protein ACI9TY_001244 [Alphaproteobacteria bacterium]|jgi:hypothetical protein